MPKRIYRVLLLAVVVTCALVQTPAAAAPEPAPGTPYTPALDQAYAFARSWWGETPTGCSSIRLEVLPDADPFMDGLPAGAVQPVVGYPAIPQFEKVCGIYFLQRTLALPQCALESLMVHELGHVLGYWHDNVPSSVMFEGGTRYWVCEIATLETALAQTEAERGQVQGRCRRAVRHQRPKASRRACWHRSRLLTLQAHGLAAELVQAAIVTRPAPLDRSCFRPQCQSR